MKRNLGHNKKTILGIISIIIGFLNCGIHMYNYAFIQYFSAIGVGEYGSAFFFGVMLFFTGIIIFRNYDLGIIFVFGFLIGNIIDRLIVYILYFDYATPDIFIVPLFSSILMGVSWYLCKESYIFRRSYLVRILIIIITIIIVPKVISVF